MESSEKMEKETETKILDNPEIDKNQFLNTCLTWQYSSTVIYVNKNVDRHNSNKLEKKNEKSNKKFNHNNEKNNNNKRNGKTKTKIKNYENKIIMRTIRTNTQLLERLTKLSELNYSR